MAHLAYKFRILPTAAQAAAMDRQLETLRRVYNSVLAYWNAKSDAWVLAHPSEPKSPRPKLTAEQRAELKARREVEKLARKAAPPREKNHNKTDEQRAAEREQWKQTRYPGLNEVYEFLTKLRDEPRSEGDKFGPDPKYLSGGHVLMSALRDTAERVRKAFARFWLIRSGQVSIPVPRKPRKDGRPHGYPRFKAYGRLDSIVFAQYGSGVKLRGRDGKAFKGDVPAARRGYRLDVSCVGRIRVMAHREIKGAIKNATVSRDVDGKWYVALMAETPDVAVEPKVGPAIGIDVGLEHFLTTSDGRHVANPKYFRSSLRGLRRLQKAASRKSEAAKKRKQKFRECKNLQKSFKKVARLHVRVRNLRKEHHHQVANRLVDEAGTICAEALNIRGMVRNGKLSRAIQDASWGSFLTVLRQKSLKAGVRFVEVDPCGTSQTCPECGAVAKKALSQRRHRCPCGCDVQRDHASALVILARGTGSNEGGRLSAVRVNDPVPVGMPRERSRGGREEQRKSPVEHSCHPDRPKPNRSRRTRSSRR